jgi:hypothetical protein
VHLNTVTVVLDFMEPLVALGRFRLQRGKLGSNEPRHLDTVWQLRNSQKIRWEADILAQFSEISNNQGT